MISSVFLIRDNEKFLMDIKWRGTVATLFGAGLRKSQQVIPLRQFRRNSNTSTKTATILSNLKALLWIKDGV